MIEVSEDVYRGLQALARPFEDEPNDVIRRLLETSAVQPKERGETGQRPGADLVSHVGRVPHGSRLRARYKGRQYDAQVLDGQVVWEGRRFESLSKAAVGVIQSTGSSRGTENGWRFWEVEDPTTGEWRPATDYQNI